MDWPVSTVLDSIVYGSTKKDAVEVLFTNNEDPYFLRIWDEGRSRDLGYFASWDDCIDHVRGQRLANDIGELVGLCGIKIGDEVVGWEFANADDAKEAASKPDLELLLLEKMADPQFQMPAAPRM